MPHTNLIRVQLALVHWVGVFDDFYLVLSKSLPIETLRGKSSTGLHKVVVDFWHTDFNDETFKHLLGSKFIMLFCGIYLKPVRDFCQLGDCGLFVHKLLLV